MIKLSDCRAWWWRQSGANLSLARRLNLQGKYREIPPFSRFCFSSRAKNSRCFRGFEANSLFCGNSDGTHAEQGIMVSIRWFCRAACRDRGPAPARSDHPGRVSPGHVLRSDSARDLNGTGVGAAACVWSVDQTSGTRRRASRSAPATNLSEPHSLASSAESAYKA